MAAPEIVCLECGHGNEGTFYQGETEFEDTYEFPDNCEECGEPLSFDAEPDGRQAERKQMGIGS